jgi:hypothetical protein
MGNCASSQDEVDAKQRSDEIDKQIEDDLRKYKKECKILLLGTCAPHSITIILLSCAMHQSHFHSSLSCMPLCERRPDSYPQVPASRGRRRL